MRRLAAAARTHRQGISASHPLYGHRRSHWPFIRLQYLLAFSQLIFHS